MPRSLRLLKKTVTLQEALGEETNILQELSYPEKRLDFFCYLYERRKEIEALVAFHLGVSRDACKVAEDFKEWVHGSFNACIPVYINESLNHGRKVFIRFPLPYKVGESGCPGNAEEKLRCEVATYIWIQTHCPDVPIPCLRGFGFPGGWSFTAPEGVPSLTRILWFFRRAALWLSRYLVPSRYIGHRAPYDLNLGYMIVDCVERGNMLSQSWEKLRHDQDRRSNLFRDLSRIMLSLSRFPFPRIGSLTISDYGVLTLTNRPLTCTVHQLENLGIQTDISRDSTYSVADTYLLDTLAYHDNRMRHMPNSINHTSDGQEQLAALALMRTLLPHFTSRDLRHGPFILMLTDIHQSNIFVDGDWHITAMIDLEWACTRPIQMQHAPYWLTSCSLDCLDGDNLATYDIVHSEFLQAFEEQERSSNEKGTPYTIIMRKGWEVGSYWYFSALDCPSVLYNLFISHIREKFTSHRGSDDDFDRTVSDYWGIGVPEFIAGKVRDKALYSDRLRQTFGADSDDLENVEYSED